MPRTENKVSLPLAYLLLASASLLPGTALAQTADEPATSDYTVDEIIVTANKREQNLNDVGMAISALSADALKDRHVTDIQDLTSMVPGLTFAATPFAAPVYTLRGVGYYEGSLANYATTTVYVDQVPLQFPMLSKHTAYDLERVEVLKGPQGTLYGANSTGGAINFINAKPTKSFEAGQSLTIGRFDRVEGNAFVSGPLSETLRARIAVSAATSGDWQKDYLDGDTNGATRYVAGRLLLQWTPSEKLEVNLNLNGWVDRSDPQVPQLLAVAPQGTGLPAGTLNQPLAPRDMRAATWGFEPRGDDRAGQIALRFDYGLTPDVTLTGLSSYVHLKHYQAIDADATPLANSDVIDTGTIKSFTQELRLANGAKNAVRWVVGLNYAHSNVDETGLFSFGQNSSASRFFFDGNRTTSDQVLKSRAIFANVEYDVAPGVTLIGGARYTKDTVTARQCTADTGTGKFANAINIVANLIQTGVIRVPDYTPRGFGGVSVGSGCTALNNLVAPIDYLPGAYVATLSQDNVSWKAGVNYSAGPNLLLYAFVAKGYKAGGFPMASASTFKQYVSVTQESLLDYEGGVKFTTDDRRMQVNLSAFYYDYTDKQLRGKIVDPVFGILGALRNIPKSRIWGLEADVSYFPIKGLTINLSGSYLNGKITDYTDRGASGTIVNFAGSEMPFAPEWSASIAADYKWDIGNASPFVGFSLFAQADQIANIGGDRGYVPAFGYRGLVPLGETFTLPGYVLADLRAGVEIDKRWSVSVFGKNVFNKFYLVSKDTRFDTRIQVTGRPATWGLTLSYKY